VNREEKAQMMQSLEATFQASPHVFVTDYRGLSANQSVELRRRIRNAGGTYRVLKNRLAKRAAAGTAAERVTAHLTGTRGVAVHPSDPLILAKVLTDFLKENPQLQLVAAVIESKEVVTAEGIKTLATLPGLPELRAQLLALMNTPATTLVRLLNTPASQVARALDARREKLEGGAS
jgi:large subunit ribosomal protein L10